MYKKQIQSCTRSRKKQKQFSSTSQKRQKHRKQAPMQPSTLANRWQMRELYSKKKEAEGIAAVAETQGFYLRNLLKEANGNYVAVRDFMMVNSGMFQEIAKINAQAVQGLQLKISVWSGANNGGGEGGVGGGGMKDVAGVYSMLPPLFQTVHEQTGMLPPTWLGTLPSSS